jgi:GxxExxY protein
MEVHWSLGAGFLEAVYHEALALELLERGVPFAREVEFPIEYKGRPLSCGYRADFVCFGEVVVELKSQRVLTAIDHAQVINYLKATGLNRALLINFGAASLEHKRFVH